jgi:hypothetical protein
VVAGTLPPFAQFTLLRHGMLIPEALVNAGHRVIGPGTSTAMLARSG